MLSIPRSSCSSLKIFFKDAGKVLSSVGTEKESPILLEGLG